MAVEIVILSGAQQGTRRVLDRSEFRVGYQPACDVKFDPQQDRSAVDREAFFRLTDEGWTVASTGLGGMFLNQQPLTKTQRVRSGDVLRMSNQGPDVAFNIVLRVPATAKDTDRTVGMIGTTAAGLGDQPLPEAPPTSFIGAAHRGRLIQGLVGLGVLVLIVLLLVQWRSANDPSPAPQPSADQRLDVVPSVASSAELKVTAPVSSTPAKPDDIPRVVSPAEPKITGPIVSTPTKSVVLDSPVVPPDPVQQTTTSEVVAPAHSVEDLLKGTVFLIELELKQRRMPFANGVAVSDRLVLTSAKQAVQLARWRKQGVAEKIWVVDHGADIKAEVQEIRVLSDCATIPADSPNWIYCNLALLTVAAKLPKHVALATPQDLEQLKDGATVFCLGTPHESWSTTWAVGRSTLRCWKWQGTASEHWPRTAMSCWEARTSMNGS